VSSKKGKKDTKHRSGNGADAAPAGAAAAGASADAPVLVDLFPTGSQKRSASVQTDSALIAELSTILTFPDENIPEGLEARERFFDLHRKTMLVEVSATLGGKTQGNY
jgi:hypothetical protein